MNTPAVAPDEFATALAAHQGADEVLSKTSARLAEAQAAIAPLTCTEEALIPDDGHGYGDITVPCRRPRSHAGPCAEHPTDDDLATSGPWRNLHAALRDAQEQNSAADRRFTEADDALDALQCHKGPAGSWGCILRRGHPPTQPHQEPGSLRLAGFPDPEEAR